ncbi:MAG: hypothetical protein ACK56I_11695, partial [bacterium]
CATVTADVYGGRSYEHRHAYGSPIEVLEVPDRASVGQAGVIDLERAREELRRHLTSKRSGEVRPSVPSRRVAVAQHHPDEGMPLRDVARQRFEGVPLDLGDDGIQVVVLAFDVTVQPLVESQLTDHVRARTGLVERGVRDGEDDI